MLRHDRRHRDVRQQVSQLADTHGEDERAAGELHSKQA
jgi:hypothetical protein